MLQLFTDTDSDFTPQNAAKYGYKIISMPYSIDGKNIFPYEDFDVYDAHAFCDKLRAGTVPTTSSISEEKYIQYFEPVFEAGNDILYVHFSPKISATFENMNRAVEKLLAKYPSRKFHTINTKAASGPSYNIGCEIGDMINAGKSVEEVKAWAETEINKFAVLFFIDTLDYLKRSGRVSSLSSFVGSVVGIRPLLKFDDEGAMIPIGKVRGRVRAFERLIQYVEELGDDIKSHRMIISHSDTMPIAEELASMLRQKFGDDLNIEIVNVNPTVICHVGPSCIGLCFHAKNR